MSDKDRRKKDGERKDKKNQAMREAESDKGQKERASRQATDTSNVTGTERGADGNPGS
ncbi:MAG TPA: hypothetical protein VGX92_02800 [Pyrinomonadaceae bacterium]|jgi:hypothetical protein|nr:hypothetical protein [Pyrinomonadaceae bacterium]